MSAPLYKLQFLQRSPHLPNQLFTLEPQREEQETEREAGHRTQNWKEKKSSLFDRVSKRTKFLGCLQQKILKIQKRNSNEQICSLSWGGSSSLSCIKGLKMVPKNVFFDSQYLRHPAVGENLPTKF